MWQQIGQFRCMWHTVSNQGKFQLQLVNNSTHEVVVDSPAEFTVLLALLNESPVWFNTSTKEIAVGPEVPG